jgi:hypothetical protein
MKKFLLATTILALASGASLAGESKQAISPEELFQQAKKECPESATTPEGWAEIRACIAEAKGRILRRDPRIAKECGKYSGKDRDECTDWVYSKGSTWSPTAEAERKKLHEKLGTTQLPEDNPETVRAGRQHMQTERQQIDRANAKDPHSNRSTITGIGGGHGGRVNGGKPAGVKTGIDTVDKEQGDLKGLKDAVIDQSMKPDTSNPSEKK